MSSFSQRFGKGLVAAMEDENEIPVDDSVYVEHADNTADVEAGLSEVGSVMEDTTALQSLTDKAQEVQERDGGLDPVAAEVLDIAVEAIYTRLGIARKPGLAMEGVTEKNGKRNVSIAVESFKETLTKIWEAIKNAFKKMVEWIKSFFTSSEKVAKKQEDELKAIVDGSATKKPATEAIALEDAEGGLRLPAMAKKYLSNWESDPSAADIVAYLSKAMGTISKNFNVAPPSDDEAMTESIAVLAKNTPPTKEEAYGMIKINSFNKNCLSQYGAKFAGISPDGNFGLFSLDLGIAGAIISFKLPSPEITDGRVIPLLQKIKCSLDMMITDQRHKLTEKPEPATMEQIQDIYKHILKDTKDSAKLFNVAERTLEDAAKEIDTIKTHLETDSARVIGDKKNAEVLAAIAIDIMKGTSVSIQQSRALLVRLRDLHIKVRWAIVEYCSYSYKVARAAK